MPGHLQVDERGDHYELRLVSEDGTNRLTRACVLEITDTLVALRSNPKAVILTGNTKFFSAGADLKEIQGLHASSALEFAKMGQLLMQTIVRFPSPVIAAIEGYCMGGGLDLALACRERIASPHAIFGHRGAALGLMTGWGGTQRLRRVVGKARALSLFLTAEKIHAPEALAIGLVDAIAEDPAAEAARRIQRHGKPTLETGAEQAEVGVG